MNRSRRILPTLALVCVTAVWGSTFFMIKDIVDVIPPLDFLGVRFIIAGLFIGLWRFRALRTAPAEVWRHGAVLGLLYSCAQVAQTIGLQHTHASVSGFITGMYVVLTPVVLLLVFRVRVSAVTWLSIALATAGLMILSLHGLAFGVGESLTLLGSVFYAIHIAFLGHWSTNGHVLELAAIQIIVVGVTCLAAALPGGVVVPSTPGQWGQMLYMALIAGMGALVLQTWAQSRISATSAAVVMTTEPLFAALFAVAFGGEHLTIRLVVGGGLILGAMFSTELVPTLTSRKAIEHTESPLTGDRS